MSSTTESAKKIRKDTIQRQCLSTRKPGPSSRTHDHTKQCLPGNFGLAIQPLDYSLEVLDSPTCSNIYSHAEPKGRQQRQSLFSLRQKSQISCLSTIISLVEGGDESGPQTYETGFAMLNRRDADRQERVNQQFTGRKMPYLEDPSSHLLLSNKSINVRQRCPPRQPSGTT
jgi:hypothetical protein